MVAGLHVVHVGADALDDAGRLVPEHGRQRVGVRTVLEMQVGVADARGSRAHEDFARAGVGGADVFYGERLVHLA